MSSDYCGAIVGPVYDEPSSAEATFLEWLNEYARGEAALPAAGGRCSRLPLATG